MDIKEYLLSIDEINTAIYTIKKNVSMKMQLVAPYKRKEEAGFILALGGSFFSHVNTKDGIYINEFMNAINKGLYPILDKKSFDYVLEDTLRNLKKVIPSVSIVEATKRLHTLFDEIRRYMNHTLLKKELERIDPYTYSILYHRACKVMVNSDLKNTSIHEMHEILNSLNYQNVLSIIYPKSFTEDSNFSSYLLEKKSFYNTYISSGAMPICGIERLKESGLDEIIIPVSSLDPLIEERLSGNKIKELMSLIKLSLTVGLKVTIETKIRDENKDYLSLLKYFYSMGVYSFIIEFDDALKDRDILLKRIHYFSLMYLLEIKLNTYGILKDKEIRRLGIYPYYKEDRVSTYYTKSDFKLYADKEFKYLLGSLSMEKIENVFNSNLAKRLRKESLKRK